MKNKIIFTSLITILTVNIFFVFPFVALGHGEGQSIEKVVGEYLVELEYEELALTAEEPVRLDFKILNNATKEDVEFTDIWVRVTQDKKTLFASAIAKPDFGKVGMTYTFSDAGEYELNLRFQNKDKSIAEASFPLAIGVNEMSKKESKNMDTIVGWVGGGIIGLIAGFFLFYFLRKKQ